MLTTKKTVVAIATTFAAAGGVVLTTMMPLGCSAPGYAESKANDGDSSKKEEDAGSADRTPKPKDNANANANANSGSAAGASTTTPSSASLDAGVDARSDTSCVGCPAGFICSAGQCVARPAPRRPHNNNQACFDQCIANTHPWAADYVQCTSARCSGFGACDDDCFEQACGGIEDECEQALQQCETLCPS